MPSIDLPLEQLWSYAPPPTEPVDFGPFWTRAVAEARDVPLDVELEPAAPKLAGVIVNRCWFNGIAGARISGWYVRPEANGPFPGVVHYHGYGGRAARPLELYTLAAQGVSVLSMDCRGQDGDAPDIPPTGAGHYSGWLTQGLRDPTKHYYRYVFTDAVRAVDALASQEEVDQDRIAVTGVSQGGGLALAAAALSGRARFVWADVPFLCDYRRAVDLAATAPYSEVAAFLRKHPDLEDIAYKTLSYFDAANHAPRIACPATVTVGLCDLVCPPSTIFGTFSRLANSDKDLMVLPYNGHEVTYDVEERRLAEILRRLSA